MGFLPRFKAELAGFFEYDTPKFVHVKSRGIGVFSRLLQLLVVCYVIGYDLVLEKGYQHVDVGISGVTTKLKGLVLTDASTAPPGLGGQLLDPPDYTVPPQMNGAFFVTTNMVVTRLQQRGHCTEDATVREASCWSDADCPPGRLLSSGNGACTGVCLRANASSLNDSTGSPGSTMQPVKRAGVCEVRAWCPVENDTIASRTALLADSRDFTVLVKNYVYFPYYNKYRSNLLESHTRAYLRSCRYNTLTDPHCPIFRLGDIVGYIDGEDYGRLALTGGVVSIRIAWDCDLDYDIKYCTPTYSFARLDGDAIDSLVAQGYNFRYAHKYVESGVEKRTLVKAFGILFLVSVTSRARAFHVIPLLMKIGSGLGLLGLSAIMCDFLVLYISRRRSAVKMRKYESLTHLAPAENSTHAALSAQRIQEQQSCSDGLDFTHKR